MKTAIAFSTFTQFFIKAINLTLVVVLARLLTPEELGLYAIVAAIVLIFSELQSLGATSFIIRENNPSKSLKRNCLGLSLLISYSIGLLHLLFATPISDFYNYPDIKPLLCIFAINFFVSPFQFIPIAMYRKNLDFKPIMIIFILSGICELVATITLVLQGWSYYSIVVGNVFANIVKTLLIFVFAKKEFIIIPHFNNLKPILKFGFYTSSIGILERLSSVTADLVIGKFGNARDTAIYSRGLGFVSFIKRTLFMGIKPVVLPYFVQSRQQQKDFRATYLKTTNMFGSILWPVFIIIGLCPSPIIKLFFGDQWGDSATLIPYLTLWIVFRSLHPFFTAYMTTIKLEYLCPIREGVHFLLILIVALVGVQFDLLTISILMALVGVFDFLFCCFLLKKHTQISFKRYLYSLKDNAFLGLAIAIFVYAMDSLFHFNNLPIIWFLLLISIPNLIFWLLMTKLLKMPIYAEVTNILETIQQKAVQKIG